MEARDSAPLADEAQPGAIPNDNPGGGAGPGDDGAPPDAEDSTQAPDEGEHGSSQEDGDASG